MNIFQTKIGDHHIQINSCSSQVLAALSKDFPSFHPSQQPDIEMTIKDGYGVPFQDYEVNVKESEAFISFTRADYQLQVQPDFKRAALFVHDELALKHALMNFYSSYIVHHNWGLLIHSSCVVDGQRAHLFSGRSGAGKSTAAQLSCPRTLLSDEATIVKITKDSVIVYDSPFRSELRASGTEEMVPLESIHLLHQSLTNKRVEVKKSDALLQLMDKVFYWPHKKEEAASILFLLKRLVEHSAVYDLYFQKNNTFWELISS
ncbi:hypothetical protein L2D08_12475 [Domibacillus sp. PGB-M46]|uniref:hypothetical protein n=1 Tax=Domibacillus sp. PGB-M46 TaxID=2910255 RepID=UPI001F59FE96|nr:hypothetical protein [Domibacillus sp. PGB-M46]MCI2255181.1 hypothetical protein [Domibacillus sp. PGB-M46]